MTTPSSSPSSAPEKLVVATAPARPDRPSTPSRPGSTPPSARGGPSRWRSQPLTIQGWLLRVFAAVALLGSVALIYWSYRELLPVQRQAREASALANRLTAEVALMEGRSSPQETEQTAMEYLHAQGLLFSTPDALGDWFQEIRKQMVPLALDATADFGRPTATNAARYALAIVPATLALNIEPAPGIGSVRSPYERLLRFLDQLSLQEKRVDLVGLQVSGGSNSVNRAVVTLQLWAGEDRRE